jgi:hypothetical protein
MQSGKYQQYQQAKRDWILANVRKESGATITPSEFNDFDKTYFPQPGEDHNTVLQKKAARIKAQESMLRNSGTALGKVQLPKVYKTDDPPEGAKPGDLWQDKNGDWYEFK